MDNLCSERKDSKIEADVLDLYEKSQSKIGDSVTEAEADSGFDGQYPLEADLSLAPTRYTNLLT